MASSHWKTESEPSRNSLFQHLSTNSVSSWVLSIFIPNCALIQEPLNSLLSTPQGSDRKLDWNETTTAAFVAIKEALVTTTLLTHPKPFASTCVTTDASYRAVGAVLQQQIDGNWHPPSYVVRPVETRCSTFDHVLIAMYLSIKHFRHLVECREFHVVTGHKSLTFTLLTSSDKYTLRQIQHLDCIS